MNYIIEKPKREEIQQLVSLCAAHAEFEKCEYDTEGKKERLSIDIFANDPKLHCRVAVVGGTYIGYITWMRQYSTWDAVEYLYMDCLFLDDKYRSQGIGVALVNDMKDFGKENGIGNIQWQTPDFNNRAIKFYRRIGASSLSKERFFLEITS
ncbi:MAG: GNAT superfamily N-acetyltransferase [Halioglobus sp.]|jgi:GNAT superfamily N-acetyltransferase